MLPKAINNTIDNLLLFILERLPFRIINRFLWLLHRNPKLADKWEYFIRKFHYYEPLPNFAQITEAQVLQRRASKSIDWQLEAQVALVNQLSVYSPELQELANEPDSPAKFNFFNEFYFELDAAIYYAIVRQVKPSKIIEIGCGYSTQIAAKAIAKNHQEGKAGKIICIEPYPQPQLTEANLEIQLIPERLEEIDLNVFQQLDVDDILFIDSTHTVKFGSDVCREILDILPLISSGVWVHFHDIFFPYDYPPEWLIEQRRAWNEQYMLEAFLAYNHDFEIILANHWLSVDYPQEVAKLWAGVSDWKDAYHRCGSLWLRKK